jgi:hypothetical protein
MKLNKPFRIYITMTNFRTFNNISFILLFCTFAVCENSDSTVYCVVDGNSTGITLNDGLGKDTSCAGKFVLLQFLPNLATANYMFQMLHLPT